jgi:hypothetical protein
VPRAAHSKRHAHFSIHTHAKSIQPINISKPLHADTKPLHAEVVSAPGSKLTSYCSRSCNPAVSGTQNSPCCRPLSTWNVTAASSKLHTAATNRPCFGANQYPAQTRTRLLHRIPQLRHHADSVPLWVTTGQHHQPTAHGMWHHLHLSTPESQTLHQTDGATGHQCLATNTLWLRASCWTCQ